MTTNTSSTVLTDAERRTLLIRANYPSIDVDPREYLLAITEAAVLEKLRLPTIRNSLRVGADPIANAIQLLTEEAASLRDCHTLTPDDWTGEPEAKAHYDRIMAVVAGLEKLHQNDSYMNHKPAFCSTYKPPK